MNKRSIRIIKSGSKNRSSLASSAKLDYDVIVVGGGLAGTFAAIAAAREGARVALFEQYGFLGGAATAAPVPIFMQYHVLAANGEIRELVKGLFEETVIRLRKRSMMLETPFIFDDIAMRCVLDDLIVEAGVDVFFHAFTFGVEMRKDRIHAMRWAGKQGERKTTARVFIDATGDGDLATAAGVTFHYGRQDGKAQPMTPMFLAAGINLSKVPGGKKGINPFLKAAHARGQSSISGVGCWVTPHPDMLLFNTIHIWNMSGISVPEMSRAEVEGRRQIMEVMAELKRHVPGFENAYVARAGVQIGVRETRHMVGQYTLNKDDVLAGRKFEDGIGRCAFEIDIHNMGDGKPSGWQVLPRGVYYEIPYRCLVPAKGPRNILVACRALSATHEANASLRIMPTMSAVGEAAGIAAARALAFKNDVSRIDAAKLKRDLIRKKIMGDPDHT